MKNNSIKFIQIIGTQRSGSNLLRVMLNQLDEIFAPHPPHLLKTFLPIVDSYGDLSNRKNRIELAEDMLNLTQHSPVSWGNIPIDAETLADKTQHHSLFGIFGTLYKQLALTKGAKFTCCKSMVNVFYHYEMEAAGIEPIYIHLYRDGRDVASSFRKAIVGPKHSYFIAKQWSQEQEACLQLKNKLGDKRVLQVSYENLIASPEDVLQKICNWIGIPYNNQMLNYYESEASKMASVSGAMWQNLTEPIIKNNVGKYLKIIPQDEILVFESIAGKQLKELGYKYNQNGHVSEFTNDQIETFKNEDNRLRNEVESQAPSIDQMSREKYNNYIKMITEKAKLKTQLL